MDNISSVDFAWVVKRSVEIQISNNTKNFTLRNPRTFFNCGICSKPPSPLVAPGSSDTCQFQGNFPFWGVSGVLAFECDSFSAAVYFSNPIDYGSYSMELGLELSLAKGHLGDLEATYGRMAQGEPPEAGAGQRVVLSSGHGSAQVTAGPVTAMATMSNARNCVIRLVLMDAR